MKEILFATSCYTQKYYFNDKFDSLPTPIKEDIKVFLIPLSHKIHGILELGFYEDDGEVYIESSFNDGDAMYDEIGAKLEIDKLLREENEFFVKLRLWYNLVILKNDMELE